MQQLANEGGSHASASSKRVVIIGGFGVVGRLIARDLAARCSETLKITLAGWRVSPEFAVANGYGALPLDIAHDDAHRALAGFDFAIIACGPTTTLGTKPHLACIRACVSCLDINDCLATTADLIKLDDAARNSGTTILTGFGLLPGLSTRLLMMLADDGGARDVKLRLYMGARNGGGPTSAQVLAAGFEPEQAILRNGRFEHTPSQWSGGVADYAFPSIGTVATLPFSSPEALTVARAGVRQISDLEVRYRVQFLPTWLARLGARLGGNGKARLAGMMTASAPRAARKKRSSALTVLVAEAGHGNCLVVHGEYSAPALTAAFAAASTEAVLGSDNFLRDGGVFTYENIHSQMGRLTCALAVRGVIVERAEWPPDVSSPSSPAGTKAEDLRHFGQCWYDVPIPAEIEAEQWRILRTSRLWTRMRASYASRFGEALDYAACGRRFVRLRKQATSFFSRYSGAALPLTLARDFSMFATGYDLCRRRLRSEARDLYTEMFMTAGAMEMNWLWPSAEVFAAQTDPAHAFLKYLGAYFKAYERLGVYQLTACEIAGYELCLGIGSCGFFEVLDLLGVPELGGLVRDMEIAAIRQRAEAVGAVVFWAPTSRAAGKLTIKVVSQETVTQ